MQVGARETFTSLSIKYDMNKAEICRLNKIHSGVVFPGQTILLKDPVHPEDYVPPPQRSLSASSIQEGSGESDSVTITTEDNQGRPEVTEIVTEQSLEFVNNTMFRVKSLYLTVDKGIVPGILEGSCDYMRFTPTNTPVIAILGVGCSVSNLGLGVHSAVLVFVLVLCSSGVVCPLRCPPGCA